ncbi:ATP-binding protein [Kocuria rhizophila]|nr:ATP-binding protein [Kocuria rhizophila]
MLAANPAPAGTRAAPDRRARAAPRSAAATSASGPLLDRVDVQLRAPAVTYHELSARRRGCSQSSATVAQRVAQARGRQQERPRSLGRRLKASVPGAPLRRQTFPRVRTR